MFGPARIIQTGKTTVRLTHWQGSVLDRINKFLSNRRQRTETGADLASQAPATQTSSLHTIR